MIGRTFGVSRVIGATPLFTLALAVSIAAQQAPDRSKPPTLGPAPALTLHRMNFAGLARMLARHAPTGARQLSRGAS